ncbi:hypothetical protein BZA05DRAFT_11133 [Tricharina praecox]|uniref:uncharacterized protein n=1 Tax=Tricharina praecox TaxID=43433 RepID=UPI00221F366D|nr:uncharacterized protein BZA05DRAFT_11133 [Tricharina praecox]KAI5858703.1 hypothetical protein BZA05DRAFT_11133 [Tricharina praecox]
MGLACEWWVGGGQPVVCLLLVQFRRARDCETSALRALLCSTEPKAGLSWIGYAASFTFTTRFTRESVKVRKWESECLDNDRASRKKRPGRPAVSLVSTIT